MLLLPGSIKSGPHSSPTADVQTGRANTQVAWTCGQAGTHSRHGQSYPWMISREIYWLEINILFAKIFTFSLSTPQSPCFIGCVSYERGNRLNPRIIQCVHNLQNTAVSFKTRCTRLLNGGICSRLAVNAPFVSKKHLISGGGELYGARTPLRTLCNKKENIEDIEEISFTKDISQSNEK